MSTSEDRWQYGEDRRDRAHADIMARQGRHQPATHDAHAPCLDALDIDGGRRVALYDPDEGAYEDGDAWLTVAGAVAVSTEEWR